MKISITHIPDTPAATPVLCAHCEVPVSGACSLVLHVVDNPEHGRPQINAFTCYQFCAPACRAAWWETVSEEPCFHDPAHITSPHDHPLSALVIHNDHGARHPITLTADSGGILAQHMGVVVAHHAFTDPEHIERWWRGEEEVEALPVPMAEAGES